MGNEILLLPLSNASAGVSRRDHGDLSHRAPPRRRPRSRHSSQGKPATAMSPRREFYAGAAFGLSAPEPSALPLPRFSRARAYAPPPAVVDDSATRGLRRLLRLEERG
ncbi:hypothetical protein AXF42_Ash003972 [Apostasia shenzhenica]|uniref:Uncharacterized protein n=1 Tax=Apostasia shenzhenica TaxID=1088818 RepID=A0A2I0AIE3_9ASPA|nr:hypothetical protein AXF42_Ash003972 [Apostasia shenzhenica]